MSEWSIEGAKKVEAKLAKLITPVIGVHHIGRGSFRGFKDFKITFGFEGVYPDRTTPPRFFLELDTRGFLRAWGGGLNDIFPKPLIKHIGDAFSNEHYSTRSRVLLQDTFHFWDRVYESDLDAYLARSKTDSVHTNGLVLPAARIPDLSQAQANFA